MPFWSTVCRRTLDEQRGNPLICECMMCRELKKVSREEDQNDQIDRFGEGDEKMYNQ
jgi:hypothetical protein